MSLFPEGESKGKRGALLVLGFIGVALAFVVGTSILLHGTMESPGSPRKERPPLRPEAGLTESTPLSSSAAPPLRIIPKEGEDDKGAVATAMETSNIRTLVRQLMVGAVTENQPSVKSMLTALGRYRGRARPLIQEEYSVAKDARVKDALGKALERAR